MNTDIERSTLFISDASFYDLSVDDKIEKIITTGLSHMRPVDFEPIGCNDEDSLGFTWACYVKSYIAQLHISPLVQVPPHENTRDKNTSIDYTFNGDIDIKVLKDGNELMCKEHVDRLENKYKNWAISYSILNFIINGDKTVKNLYESRNIPVFHYLKSTNTLYKGNKILQQGVVKHMHTPTSILKRGISSMSHVGVKILTNSLKYVR
jgi:hypothetical protein